jgi:hypothetical protein
MGALLCSKAKAVQHEMALQRISSIKEIIKTQLSAGKIKASVFWESKGVIRVDFLPCGVTINA